MLLSGPLIAGLKPHQAGNHQRHSSANRRGEKRSCEISRDTGQQWACDLPHTKGCGHDRQSASRRFTGDGPPDLQANGSNSDKGSAQERASENLSAIAADRAPYVQGVHDIEIFLILEV